MPSVDIFFVVVTLFCRLSSTDASWIDLGYKKCVNEEHCQYIYVTDQRAFTLRRRRSDETHYRICNPYVAKRPSFQSLCANKALIPNGFDDEINVCGDCARTKRMFEENLHRVGV